jgi:hypothetical protein
VANVCGIPASQRKCSASGWCWENPLPHGVEYTAIWGFSRNDVWATGQYGTLERWNGTEWTRVPLGTTANLWGVWGAAPNDLWVVGSQNTLLHWNGSTWSPTANPCRGTLRDVHGTSSSDVWITSAFGSWDTCHWNGSTWQGHNSRFDSPTRLWATAPNSVWGIEASYSGGFRWDGITWVEENVPDDYMNALWASSSTDVWLAGDRYVYRWNGSAWSSVGPEIRGDGEAIWGTGPSDVWAMGASWSRHWDGTRFQDHALRGHVTDLWGSASNDIWGVGPHGTRVHWDGSAWTQRSGLGVKTDIKAVWGSGPQDLWLAGEASLLRWTGGGLMDLTGQFRDRLYATALWGTGPQDVWMARDGEMWHWDGVRWAQTPLPYQDTAPAIRAIWGLSANAVWAVTDRDFFGSGENAHVLYWDGTRWIIQGWIRARTSFADDLMAVWGTGPSDVWAGGTGGELARWDGSRWNQLNTPTTRTIRAIWGTGSSDIWLGTDEGLFRGNGTTWTRVSHLTVPIVAIAATSPTDVWVATQSPVVHHWNGSTWSTQDTEAGAAPVQLWAGGGHVWFVTATGGMVHRP